MNTAKSVLVVVTIAFLLSFPALFKAYSNYQDYRRDTQVFDKTLEEEIKKVDKDTAKMVDYILQEAEAERQNPKQKKLDLSLPPGFVEDDYYTKNFTHSCIRNKKIYDCGERVIVIRPNGELACKPEVSFTEPGSKVCTDA